MFTLCRISLPLVFQTFNILQQCLYILCLTIDNRLTPIVNDCYTRISIGSKLQDMDIVLRNNVISLTECEEYCLKNKHVCNAFSFGVGVKGNSTCLISSQTPVLENLETHPEYDVYARKRQDSLSCDFDRIYRNFNHKNGNHLMKINKLIKKEFMINNDNSFSKLLSKSEPILLPPHNTLSFSRNKNDMENYGPIGTYDLFINRDRYSFSDDNRNILDIIKNKNGRIPIDDFDANNETGKAIDIKNK